VHVRNLISIAYIKALSKQLGFSSVNEKGGNVTFQIANAKNINFDAIGKAAAKYKRQLMLNAGANPYLAFRIADADRSRLLDNIKIMLQDLKSFEVK